MSERPMNIVIVGHNYAPEPIGIGPYTAGLAEYLAAAGHRVRVICDKPAYPGWAVMPGYVSASETRSVERGVEVCRVAHGVAPAAKGFARVRYHLAFAWRAAATANAMIRDRRPDVIVSIAPSIIATVLIRLLAFWYWRIRLWVHIHDFETELAVATGQFTWLRLFKPALRLIEHWALRSGRTSSISPAMCRRLRWLGRDPARVVEFRNWANPAITPLDRPSPFRDQWGITEPNVALYSGNMAGKQGLDVVLAAARLLIHRTDLVFVICGEGPHRPLIEAAARDCGNVRFFDLVPADRMRDLLGLATVHLLPQIAGAADLVLPSKLPNMLASGRPVVATARAGTGLAHEVEGCGISTCPHDPAAFARAIETLLDDPAHRTALGAAAIARAATHWHKEMILSGITQRLVAYAEGERRRAPAIVANAVVRLSPSRRRAVTAERRSSHHNPVGAATASTITTASGNLSRSA
ncbi:WcaI family glycosyltransferase [Sphingomonas sp. NBWT7]|nr:WcaI family glycosyltransferase [Sphingomonas sp. NBWT7]QNE32741.1 WcaI family glycosyltransferase [Sphingomonas sp. NBWT7]